MVFPEPVSPTTTITVDYGEIVFRAEGVNRTLVVSNNLQELLSAGKRREVLSLFFERPSFRKGAHSTR